MDVAPVDPRDVHGEVDRPRYRVHSWTGPTDGAAEPVSDEYELSGSDVGVGQVLRWAAERAVELRADRFEVFAVVDRASGGRGLVRLTPSR